MALNKAQVLNHITEAFRKEFIKGLENHPTQWPKVAMEISSTTKILMVSWVNSPKCVSG